MSIQNNKSYSFDLCRKLFQKVILQSFIIAFIILAINLRAEAITGTWDGLSALPDGWYTNNILGLRGDSLNAGEGQSNR